MKTLKLFAALALALPSLLSAQSTTLYVQHPQLLKSGSGTIEEAVVAMTPNGAFMRYDVTMTFSARNAAAFLPNDSIEVTYQFPLPAESVLNDLWLWVGKDLSRGLILDRATASSTYENIVKRRRDPAFLQKTTADRYQLQIYPMAASGSRTVKFTFNAPMKRTANQWYALVPSALFRTSYVPLQSLRVIYYAPSLTHIPSVLNDARYGFTAWTDSLTTVAAWKCDVPNEVFAATDPVIAVPTVSGDASLVTQFAGTGGGTYHVLVDPFAMLGVSESRKFVIAFDYDSVKTTVQRAGYIEAVRSMLKLRCTARDSFNVVFNDWQRSGEKWFAADSVGITAAFKTLGASTIPNGSNIPGLFMNAIEFLNSAGGGGSILLVAASDKLGASAAADPVVAFLRQKLPAGTVVHVADLLNRNGNSYYNGGYFYGNTYFYDAVKALTGGTVRMLAYNEDPVVPLSDVMQTMSGGLSSVDLLVRYENGFTHSKLSYGIVPFQRVFTGQLVGQIGKYAGSGPLTIELAGFYRGQPYQKKLAVPASSIMPADSSLRAIWVGKYITDIEWSYNTSVEVVKQITNECMKERVVCRYTALLALEPGDTILKAKNDRPIQVTSAGNAAAVPAVYDVASAYPNPFNPSTTLRVRLPQGARVQDATMKIYNMLGQLVKTFEPVGVTSESYTEFRWDATDDAGRRAASGMYLFVVTTPGARHTVKLMLLK